MELTSLQKLPTLSEIFFGKGIDPATDKPYVKAATKKVDSGNFPNGMTEKKVVSKKKLEK